MIEIDLRKKKVEKSYTTESYKSIHYMHIDILKIGFKMMCFCILYTYPDCGLNT